MIHNPFLILLFLAAIETCILCLSNHAKFKKYFDFIPSVFWIYFLPMLCSTFGLIDAKSSVYSNVTNQLLPAALFILLMTVDVKAILRLGPTALLMFFVGAAGIILGAVISFGLFKSTVGPQFWSGFGALSASWTGGSANMIAVKEALSTPDDVFLPMVVVDTIVPYLWMGFLVAVVSFQPLFDRWNQSNRSILDELGERAKTNKEGASNKFSLRYMIAIIVLGLAASFFSQDLAKLCPVVKDMISTYAWSIVIVTTLGVIISFTPLRQLEQYQSNKIGYVLLYFVLTTIGAKASLAHIATSTVLILAGFVIVLIHIFILLLFARLIRAPMFLVAVASQANIGGVASAPVVAEIYHKGLASVGLLLAILGNIVGTYLGIMAAQACRAVAG